jgi:hypothetical protein
MTREPYFNMAPRTMIPNRLSPPKPITIAVSEVLVLLERKKKYPYHDELQMKFYHIIGGKIKNLNCHFLSLKNFSTPPTHSVHLLPT